LGSSILIIARTDALQGLGYDEALKRLRAVVAAGADIGFLEGITSRDECRRICKDMAPTPMLLNMVEHGATPSISPEEAQEMGFRVIIFPFAAIAPAYYAIRAAFERVKETGWTGLQKEFTPKRLFEIVGLKEAQAVDSAAGGALYSKV